MGKSAGSDTLRIKADSCLQIAFFCRALFYTSRDISNSKYGRSLPARSVHQFATAIRANALHLFCAIFAKSAFVRANVCFVARR